MKYFIDFEATQFSNEIISIGCVREDGECFYSLVNTRKKITKFITELTGITKEDIATAPSPETVFSSFFSWCALDDGIPEFFCYGDSDFNFVKKNFEKSTNFTAKAMLGYIYTGLVDYSPYVKFHFGLAQNIGLKKVASYYQQKEIEQTHNALDDAQMLKYVYDMIQITPIEEDVDAFPDYKAKETTLVDIPQDVKIIKIHSITGAKIEFNSLEEAVNAQIKNSSTHKYAIPKNVNKRIKKAIRDGSTYCNYYWTLEE